MNTFKLFCGLLLIIYHSSNAQNSFWGMTYRGGEYNSGVIFELDSLTENMNIRYSFKSTYGGSPRNTSLTKIDDDNYVGITQTGGLNNKGLLFRYNHQTKEVTELHSFGEDMYGAYPVSAPILASNGLLYGTISGMDCMSCGTIYKYDLKTNKINFLYNPMPSSTYINSICSIIEVDGNLIGMSTEGGIYNKGAIYKINLNDEMFSFSYSFSDIDGIKPYGNLTSVPNKPNFVYGLTNEGGKYGFGTIFQFDYNKLDFKVIYEFNSTDGKYPFGSLLFHDNKLFGLACKGGDEDMGTIFSYSLIDNSFSKLANLDAIIGESPKGSLLYHNGYLYGFTSNGCSVYGSRIFKLNLTNNDLTALDKFRDLEQGNLEFGSLNLINDSIIIGTSSHWYYNEGTIFSINTKNEIAKVEYEFGKPIDGAFPNGTLVYGNDGMLYGLTSKGGKNFTGVLFQFDPVNYTYTPKIDLPLGYHIGSTDGTLIKASNGKFYGINTMTCSSSIFEYDPKKNQINTVGGINGYAKRISIVNSDKLIITSIGDDYFPDAINLFDIKKKSITVLHEFKDKQTGLKPMSTVIGIGSNIYATTKEGGIHDAGTIFMLNISNRAFAKIYDFDETNGKNPSGNLVLKNNKIFGLTNKGGQFGDGVIFSYDLNSNAFKKESEFDNLYSAPSPGLILGENGKLIGLANNTWDLCQGRIFDFDDANSSLQDKHSLLGLNGRNIANNNLIQIDSKTLQSNAVTINQNITVWPNPFTDKVQLKNAFGNLKIFDTKGILLIDKQVIKSNDSIDLSNFEPGIYILEINNSSEKSTRKLIKN